MNDPGDIYIPPYTQHMSDKERIATLEANARNMARDVKAIKDTMATMALSIIAINNALSEMSGGKKALMGLFGLIGGAIGAVATVFGLHLFGK